MTTPARPGSFTGATDNAASGGLFTDTLIDGIPDIVGADVARAETAATNAETSATGAATSATNAATSETNAGASATSASTSATNAATSATNAATSASTTAADAATATVKASEAATSATNAASSETAAAGSATSASSSATSATSSANTAVTSASAAGTSETNAATSATNSANSATASASSASASASSATASANSATASQTAQTAAELAETNAETAETNAETAETGAATSATNAANSASAASTSETNAATSATNSANSATASANSATASANSATAAAASEAAAAGYVDNFDDKYLGAKTSDPTVDNDGDPLTDGALYYNTTDNRMKVYDLGTTTWLFLAPTNAEQTNINTVANDITNVNTVATNITDVNSFADTYFISATAPASPTTGDLWFDTTNSIMKVYDGSGFVNAGSSVNGTSARYDYTATAGQTTFAAVYDTGYVDVYLNGVKLAPTDFTATNGSTIVLTTGAALNDTVGIVGYGTFSVASAVTLPDNVKATFGDSSDLQIYHDGSNSYISDTGTGNLFIKASNNLILESATGENYLAGVANGSVTLYHNAVAKIATTSTGVNVTGVVGGDTLNISGTGSGDIGIIKTTANSGTGLYINSQTANQIDLVGYDGSAANAVNIRSGGATGSGLNVNTSNNVGIGTTAPSQKLTVEGTANNQNSEIKITASGVASGYLGSNSNGLNIGTDSHNIVFKTGVTGGGSVGATGSERLRLDSGGKLNVNNTTGSARVNISADNWPENALALYSAGIAGQTNFAGMGFFNQDADSPIGQVADIYTNPTGTLSLTASGNPAIQLKYGSHGISGGTPALTVDNAGRVGIGNTSPNTTTKLDVNGAARFGNSTDGIVIENSTGSYGIGNASYIRRNQSTGNLELVAGSTTPRNMLFKTKTNGAESARISSTGRLLVNTTNASPSNISSGTVGGCSFGEDNGGEIASDAYNTFQINKLNSTSGGLIAFRYNATQVGYIGTNGTTTSYNTSSDYRLKENVTAITSATDRLNQLNPVRFNFIADADTTVDGFIAHEVATVIPEAISGEKDEVDADGNAVMQGIDQSKLVPLLTAALQEALTKIDQLETRITALEA